MSPERLILYLSAVLVTFALTTPAGAQAPVAPVMAWIGDWVDDDPPQLLPNYGRRGKEAPQRDDVRVEPDQVPSNQDRTYRGAPFAVADVTSSTMVYPARLGSNRATAPVCFVGRG